MKQIQKLLQVNFIIGVILGTGSAVSFANNDIAVNPIGTSEHVTRFRGDMQPGGSPNPSHPYGVTYDYQLTLSNHSYVFIRSLAPRCSIPYCNNARVAQATYQLKDASGTVLSLYSVDARHGGHAVDPHFPGLLAPGIYTFSVTIIGDYQYEVYVDFGLHQGPFPITSVSDLVGTFGSSSPQGTISLIINKESNFSFYRSVVRDPVIGAYYRQYIDGNVAMSVNPHLPGQIEFTFTRSQCNAPGANCNERPYISGMGEACSAGFLNGKIYLGFFGGCRLSP